MTSLSINELQKSFKKEPKNSQIYLDVIHKLTTFAPSLLERQSLMIDILLMIKGSENKNKKTSKNNFRSFFVYFFIIYDLSN